MCLFFVVNETRHSLLLVVTSRWLMPAKVGSGGAGLPWKVTTVAAAGGCFASVSVTRCKLQIIHVSERVHFFQKL